MGFFLFSLSNDKKSLIHEKYALTNLPTDPNSNRNMYLNGASSKEGSGARVMFIPPNQQNSTFSFKLNFKTTNNIVEYRALVLGLETTQKLNIQNLLIFCN